MHRRNAIIASLLASSLFAAPAMADVVSLNFEGISTSTGTQILDYYNGGTASNGTSGTNYGISFGDTAITICLNTASNSCSNTSHGGLGDPASADTGLFFLSGSNAILNDAAGFTTGFSFNYASNNTPGSVQVYDGLDGTGNLLATVVLPVNSPGCGAPYNAAFCPFGPAGVTFAGVAKSISFAGVANQIVFDDVTFGSATPGTPSVPEPAAWAMMVAGFGAVGGAMRRKRVRASAVAAA